MLPTGSTKNPEEARKFVPTEETCPWDMPVAGRKLLKAATHNNNDESMMAMWRARRAMTPAPAKKVLNRTQVSEATRQSIFPVWPPMKSFCSAFGKASMPSWMSS